MHERLPDCNFMLRMVRNRLFHWLRLHLREEQDVLDGRGVRHEHGQTVYAHSHSGCGRHPVFEGTHEVHVDIHGLIVTVLPLPELVLEPFELVDRVVQLAVCVGKLFPADEKLEPFRCMRWQALSRRRKARTFP